MLSLHLWIVEINGVLFYIDVFEVQMDECEKNFKVHYVIKGDYVTRTTEKTGGMFYILGYTYCT